MTSNLDRHRTDLCRLLEQGKRMLLDLAQRERATHDTPSVFENEYQNWYTESCSVIAQILPGRLAEFEEYYKGQGQKKRVTAYSYTIQDWLVGFRSRTVVGTGKKLFDDWSSVAQLFNTQFLILAALQARFESSLFDIRQLVQADLFDSELGAARELLKHKFLRAAGAVAGVVLEKHLLQVCENHAVTVRKKQPSIGDLNDALKAANIIDVPVWRPIQRLGDLRNLCDHQKDHEPRDDEVRELLDGVEKTLKTLY